MSHAVQWCCRSCDFVLGQVRDGVLYLSAPVERINAQGAARITCPQCGTARTWHPARVRATMERAGSLRQ